MKMGSLIIMGYCCCHKKHLFHRRRTYTLIIKYYDIWLSSYVPYDISSRQTFDYFARLKAKCLKRGSIRLKLAGGIFHRIYFLECLLYLSVPLSS